MQDYRKMDTKLFQATENAVNTLIRAQRDCEEISMSEPETELKILSGFQRQDPKAADKIISREPLKPSK